MLVANTDNRGTVAALASDGRTVQLLLVHHCGLFAAQNPQGTNYEFDLGVRGTGTGVGCLQVAGSSGRSLVGLKVNLNAAGQPQSVQRSAALHAARPCEGSGAAHRFADAAQPLPCAHCALRGPAAS